MTSRGVWKNASDRGCRVSRVDPILSPILYRTYDPPCSIFNDATYWHAKVFLWMNEIILFGVFLKMVREFSGTLLGSNLNFQTLREVIQSILSLIALLFLLQQWQVFIDSCWKKGLFAFWLVLDFQLKILKLDDTHIRSGNIFRSLGGKKFTCWLILDIFKELYDQYYRYIKIQCKECLENTLRSWPNFHFWN